MTSPFAAEGTREVAGAFGLTRTVVEVGDSRVTVFTRDADGPQVLGLHGGFTDPVADFGPLVSGLDQRLSLILPVLRAHGGELEPVGPVGPASIAADALDLAAALELDRPVLAGFSLGARAAMLAAAAGLDTPALVLLGPRFVGFGREEFDALQALVFRFSPEWAEPSRAASMRALDAGIVDFSIEPQDWAASIGELPVLVLRGDRDRICSAGEMELFTELLPNARLVTLAGHGHRLGDTAAPQVSELINDFLQDVLVA
jgi:pimeloyl-ACP methyl ester carboxylesterase